VLVDGNYTRGANGEAAYQPRDKEEIELVRFHNRRTCRINGVVIG
jgi:hypothetical protein